jgi:hypothetical protein
MFVAPHPEEVMSLCIRFLAWGGMSAGEVSSGLTVPSAVATVLASGEQPVAPDGWFSGADQVATDARVMLLLLRDARNRACARLFGVSEQDAGLVTIIALALLAHAANRKAHEVLKPIRSIRRGDAWLAEGVLSEGLYRIGGESSREAPVLGSVVLAAVLVNSLRPPLRDALRDVRFRAHRFRLEFDHRYGHLIRPNRPRRQPTRA